MIFLINKKNNYYIENKRSVFLRGMKGGIPIGLGYLAVSFSLGIAAQNAGLSALQSLIASFLCNASAGEYAGFTSIAMHAAYIEIALITFVANARYLLMSCAMSQRMDPQMPLYHRLMVGYTITDEIFGITIARPGYINPYFAYGAFAVASPCWAIGTALGAFAGNLLPLRAVSSLSVALYGMFLAVVIPSAKKSKVIAAVVCVCFVLSYLASVLPIISDLSDGTRIIILTVVISSVAAILFPHAEDCEDTK